MKTISTIFTRIKNKIYNWKIEAREKSRARINKANRRRLKNTDVSVIASNCNGGCLCHDLGLKFNSPFINLWLYPKDFLKFLNDPMKYIHADLEFVHEEGIKYPVGKILDIKLYFMHYKSETEAAEKWYDRRERINWDKLFVMFTDRDGCSYEMIKEFDELPYKNKVIFTHVPMPDIKSAVYIKDFRKCNEVGICSDYKYSGWYGLKYYDRFDYVKWINEGIVND